MTVVDLHGRNILALMEMPNQWFCFYCRKLIPKGSESVAVAKKGYRHRIALHPDCAAAFSAELAKDAEEAMQHMPT